MSKIKIGFVGMGWVGGSYYENFKERGFDVVGYSKEKDYSDNKDKIKFCDIVFVTVPTPSTPQGFDDSILIDVLKLIGKDKIAVIKSTILPGTTEKLQAMYPDIYLFHSPEFLTEKTAKYDAANPARNIIGCTAKSFTRAQEVMNVLSLAPYEAIVPAKEAELVKYAGNCWFYFKVVFINTVYDLSEKLGVDYDKLIDMMAADKRIGRSHLDASHQGGRGAGGHCFIKDMAAYSEMYNKFCQNDFDGNELLRMIQKKNIGLLTSTGKSLDLLKGVYGEELFI